MSLSLPLQFTEMFPWPAGKKRSQKHKVGVEDSLPSAPTPVDFLGHIQVLRSSGEHIYAHIPLTSHQKDL